MGGETREEGRGGFLPRGGAGPGGGGAVPRDGLITAYMTMAYDLYIVRNNIRFKRYFDDAA